MLQETKNHVRSSMTAQFDREYNYKGRYSWKNGEMPFLFNQKKVGEEK